MDTPDLRTADKALLALALQDARNYTISLLDDWETQVREWTASAFAPYPGFSADPYAEYAAPFFDTHRSLRGGSFATRSRMRKPRYRNYYEAHRDDFLVGFRSCPSD